MVLAEFSDSRMQGAEAMQRVMSGQEGAKGDSCCFYHGRGRKKAKGSVQSAKDKGDEYGTTAAGVVSRHFSALWALEIVDGRAKALALGVEGRGLCRLCQVGRGATTGLVSTQVETWMASCTRRPMRRPVAGLVSSL